MALPARPRERCRRAEPTTILRERGGSRETSNRFQGNANSYGTIR